MGVKCLLFVCVNTAVSDGRNERITQYKSKYAPKAHLKRDSIVTYYAVEKEVKELRNDMSLFRPRVCVLYFIIYCISLSLRALSPLKPPLMMANFKSEI